MKLNAKILITCILLAFTCLDLISARHRPHNRREMRAEKHANKLYEELCEKQEAQRKMRAHPIAVYTAWRRDPNHRYMIAYNRIPATFHNEQQTVQELLDSARPHCQHLGNSLRAYAAAPHDPYCYLKSEHAVDLKQTLAHHSIVIVSESDAKALHDRQLKLQFDFTRIPQNAAPQNALAHCVQQPLAYSQPLQEVATDKEFQAAKGLLNDLDKSDKPSSPIAHAIKAKDGIAQPTICELPKKDTEKEYSFLLDFYLKKQEEQTIEHNPKKK